MDSYNQPNNQPNNFSANILDEKKELKQLRSISNNIGLGVFLFFVISSLISLICIPVFEAFGLYNKLNYLKEFNYMEPAIYFSFTGICFIIVISIVSLVIAKLSKSSFSELIHFKKVKSSILIPYIGLGLLFCGLANAFTEQIINTLNAIGIHPSMPSSPYDNSILSIVLNAIVISILPAMMEEFLFRGVILGVLRKYGNGFAIMVSAIIFSMIHGNIAQSCFALIVGLALGFIAVKTGSIIPGMIIHFINNLSCLIIAIVDNNTKISSAYTSAALNIFFVILGLISLLYLIKEQRQSLTLPRYSSPIPMKKRMTTFFSSPMMVVFIIIFIICILV